MRRRLHIDPPRVERCTFDITLKDGSGAQCGRRISDHGLGLCTQHAKMATARDLDDDQIRILRSVFADGDDIEPEHFWWTVRLINEVERRRSADRAAGSRKSKMSRVSPPTPSSSSTTNRCPR